MSVIQARFILSVLFLGIFGSFFLFYQQVVYFFFQNIYINSIMAVCILIGLFFSLSQRGCLQRSIRWMQNHEDIEKLQLNKNKMPSFLKSLKQWHTVVKNNFYISTSQVQQLRGEADGRLESNKNTIRYLMGLILFFGVSSTFYQVFISVDELVQSLSSSAVTNWKDPTVIAEIIKNLSAGVKEDFMATGFGFFGFLLLGAIELVTESARSSFCILFESWLGSNSKKIEVYTMPSSFGQEKPYHQALTSTVETLESIKNTMLEDKNYKKDFREMSTQILGRISSLADQMHVEQRLMMKLAEGQIALQKALEKITAKEDNSVKEDIKAINRAVQQMAKTISSGNLTKDIKKELHFLIKNLRTIATKKESKTL